jgi:3-hydroxymyristoyl/3-hydroxydecanoyl-(acyl carrier protein) dehydratase
MSNKSIFSEDPVLESEMASAVYHVSGSAPFVLGHYPSDAIFPGVMSLHCMKVLSDELLLSLKKKKIEKVQLKRISYIDVIRPGDVLNIQSKVKKEKNNQVIIQSNIEAGGIIKSKSSFVYSYSD